MTVVSPMSSRMTFASIAIHRLRCQVAPTSSRSRRCRARLRRAGWLTSRRCARGFRGSGVHVASRAESTPKPPRNSGRAASRHAGDISRTRNDPRAAHVPAARQKRRQVGPRTSLAATIVADTHELGRDRERAGPPSQLHAARVRVPFDPEVRVEERHAEHASTAHWPGNPSGNELRVNATPTCRSDSVDSDGRKGSTVTRPASVRPPNTRPPRFGRALSPSCAKIADLVADRPPRDAAVQHQCRDRGLAPAWWIRSIDR